MIFGYFYEHLSLISIGRVRVFKYLLVNQPSQEPVRHFLPILTIVLTVSFNGGGVARVAKYDRREQNGKRGGKTIGNNVACWQLFDRITAISMSG